MENKTVLVLDMQPIDPPVGGGRLRLLGLYHNLGSDLQTTYIGTFDWPGERYRDHNLSETLREIDIPLSKEHFDACNVLQSKVNGKTIIDTTFHQLAHFSEEFVSRVRMETKKADVIIFSHPWVYPLVEDIVDKDKQLVIYDSQNVEGYLRYTLLDDGGKDGSAIVREVIRVEHDLCHFADIILACSHEDRILFNKLYDVPFKKMQVVPNGTFTDIIKPVNDIEKRDIKHRLGLGNNKVAIFIGSNYAPNVEAARFIIDEIAPKMPDITFIVVGGVGNGISSQLPRENIRITGFVDDSKKALYLQAADIAVNPMFSGSGTNIKLFDFMAAGLPIVSTDVGARGIEQGLYCALKIGNAHNFEPTIREILDDTQLFTAMADSSRQLVEEKYSWESISRRLGLLIETHRRVHAVKAPFFSIVVPTYNRHSNLNELMGALSAQQYKDFEVIVVDQSSAQWDKREKDFGFPLTYIHEKIKGAVKARNTGAFYARGKVLAFTDDDCLPAPDWLSGAKSYLHDEGIVGLEGLIVTDELDDHNYRPVKNEGIEGCGFMTANLFLDREIFNRINGFDEKFDKPHFREDTDIGWRALEFGKIPFGDKARVYHPPQLRNTERESLAERNKFFEKDALLMQKYPQRYMELFLKENHWKLTPGFWDNLLRGAKKYNVDISKYEVFQYYREMHPEKATVKEPAVMRENENTPLINELNAYIADFMKPVNSKLASEIPSEIRAKLASVENVTKEVKRIIGDKTHGYYFDSSMDRYNHYFSAAQAFLSRGATVLDVGNAPGHVGIGLHLLGMKVQGLNLNDCWRDTYPSPEWLETFHVISHDIEKNALPYDDNMFDAIYFTEVLEHIAIKNPVDILTDFRRVLKPGGMLILSTPNICNISNIFALMKGKNVFWTNEMFYGSLDRHNREYTPDEVYEVVSNAGFGQITMYGFNCTSNWRSGGVEFSVEIIRKFGDNHPLLKNTIMLYAYK